MTHFSALFSLLHNTPSVMVGTAMSFSWATTGFIFPSFGLSGCTIGGRRGKVKQLGVLHGVDIPKHNRRDPLLAARARS
jgi:hypothetical protein